MSKDPTLRSGLSVLIPKQLDKEKITDLENRVHELTAANNELRQASIKTESDTHDLVLYFQRELDMKDEIVARLNDELVKRDEQLRNEVGRMQKKFDDDIGYSKLNHDLIVNDLKSKLESALADLQSVEIYRNERDVYDGKLQQLERSLQEQRQQLFDAVDEQERKFLEEKALLLKSLDEQKSAFRDIALKDARSAMGEEAKKIVSDNLRLNEELKFHINAAAEHQAEKTNLSSQLVHAKRDLLIMGEKELEYARQLHTRMKEIKSLRDRIEQLEFQQSVYTEKFKHKANELKTEVNRELEEASVDITGLRRLLSIKNKELRHMKALSTTILRQRSDTEQFFLEALDEVKTMIQQERKLSIINESASESTNKAHKAKYARGAMSLPAIQQGTSSKDSRSLEDFCVDEVNISDMRWTDKELVLRILFSKVNAVVK